MRHFFAIILLTGAITLSLELLASRILTPYFGVSLYIWSGILSITLVALALGYWWGGRLCRGVTKQRRDKLVFLFGLLPAVSCISLVVACLLYPKVYLPLAKVHLVYGSFLACVILLFVPLVCLSAMNPILVAIIGSERKQDNGGDAGAGFVFFISTLGSVAGVLLTAFYLIPNSTNFRSVVLLAFLLSLLAIWPVIATERIERRHRRRLVQVAFAGAILALLLFFGSDRYLNKDRPIRFNDQTWRLLDEVPTFFGNIKIVQMIHKPTRLPSEERGNSPTRYTNLYLTDATIQGAVGNDGLSHSLYIYALESLARATVSRPQRILVLGLASGCIPMRYARDCVEIDVVEINPLAVKVAERYFQYDPSTANVINADARVFMRHCEKTYDLIFFDLFRADSSTPEYLLTVEFLRDLASRLSPHGAVLFNVASSPDAESYFAVLKTVGSVMPELRMYYLDIGHVTNIAVLASRRKLADVRPAPLPDVPRYLHEPLIEMLRTQRVISQAAVSRAIILTDDNNPYSFVNGSDLLRNRKVLTARFPPEFLVN